MTVHPPHGAPAQPQQGQCSDCRNVMLVSPVGGMWRCEHCAHDWQINQAAKRKHQMWGIVNTVFGGVALLLGLMVGSLILLLVGAITLTGGIIRLTWAR